MADSDGEYVGDLSDDDLGDPHATTAADASAYGTRSKAGRGNGKTGDGRKGGRSKAAWEDIKRSWEHVVETEDGSITVEALLEAEKRRRLMRDTTPFQRGIIRHLMLVLDMSFAMAEKDLLPNRYLLTLHYAVDFVREYFEQNPISQLGIVGMRDGIAVRISDMGGNPAEHVEKLRTWAEQQEPQGNPSLQNALEMCRGALFHAPSHGTREVLIISGALLSSDPGDIHDTITNLLADRIRVSVVGLAAQVAICEQLCSRTNGGDPSSYAVALHEQHFRELFLAATTPPVTHSTAAPSTSAVDPQNSTNLNNQASLLMMGFPSRALASKDHVSLCACHNRPTREGYACTRCRAKVCRLPAECPVCALTLVLSTHLARSYHHLFPLRGWVEVPWAEAGRSSACFACLAAFPAVPPGSGKGKGVVAGAGREKGAGGMPPPEAKTAGVSESGRYACTVCGNHFCIDCDVFAHEMIHNCPGCQSDTRGAAGAQADGNGEAVNGRGQAQDHGNAANEAMVIDS
ncbi:Ssl1-like-domain-containing protein [Parachaetomium inaequale]|uniref:General transcription and DNA repair factor IIH n=1 Tax=Parachaetomium inaequale TaxID=2588326 RepID=A0AAN6PEX8_9PEZI|nr:Ssl1-like-domain-containing protein [Parachaetomium inaequale]